MNVLKMFRPSTDREQLRAAIAARTEAQRKVAESREIVGRLRAVIDQADRAARAAANATREANEARQRWVRDGCLSNAREHQALADAAAEAARVAQRAAADADAVSKELSRAEDAIRSAESDLRDSERRVKQVIALDFVDELGPTFDRRKRLIAELQACEVEIRGLLEYAEAVCAEAAQRIEAIVARDRLEAIPTYAVTHSGTLLSQPPDEVLALTRVWRDRAAQLRQNPDA
jgi:chromosome segregation ATPase